MHSNHKTAAYILSKWDSFAYKNFFVKAADLCIGFELMDNNGNTLVVEQIFRETLHDETVKVYNFPVEDHHTYYVGNSTILVHNAEKYGKPAPFTEEQQKLLKEAKALNKNGGVKRSQAKDFVKRSQKAGLRAEIHEGHMQRMDPTKPMPGVSGRPHLHPHNHKLHIPIIED